LTGGIYLLKQGLQRRLCVTVNTVADSGAMPLVMNGITDVSVGSVVSRPSAKAGMDSYQEEDLQRIRDDWKQLFARRKKYLEKQLQDLTKKYEKTEAEAEREQHLIRQWISLTEENNSIHVPLAGSGIPGAPLSPTYDPHPGLEKHFPVLFLNMKDDLLCVQDEDGNVYEEQVPAGLYSTVPQENHGQSIDIPIIRHHLADDGVQVSNVSNVNGTKAELGAVCVWDSSIHNSPHLNKCTALNERVYLLVKVSVHLMHPAIMEVILRKRICVQISKKNQGLNFYSLMKRFGRHGKLYQTGVRYDIVSNIPKASEELEDRETLAQMAAEEEDAFAMEGETYIEQYIKGLGAVENLLAVDHVRQKLALNEMLQARGAPTSLALGPAIRKTASVPNISMLSGFDVTKSESTSELSAMAESFHAATGLPSKNTPRSDRIAARPKSLFTPNLTPKGLSSEFLCVVSRKYCLMYSCLVCVVYIDRKSLHNVGAWLSTSPYALGMGSESYG
jgi:kinesin family protein 13